MRNANWTRVLTILLSLLALYALLAVLAGIVQRFITPLLLVILASIIAFVLTPVVDLFQRTLRIYRGMAILMTYLLLICVIGSIGYFMATPLIDQTKALTDAIKNPTAQNLTAVLALKNSASAYEREVSIYETNVAQPSGSCTPGSTPCAPGPCYAAYFLKYTGYPGPPTSIWSGSGCSNLAGQGASNGPYTGNAVWNNWRVSGILHPFQALPPIVPNLLLRLSHELAKLSQSSVRSIPAGKQSSSPPSRIPTTQIPSSYSKPVKTDLQTLRADVARARSDLVLRNGAYISDAARILKDAQAVDTGARDLYSKVKNSPIIVMAFQNVLDQYHLPINVGSAVTSAISKVRGQTTTVLNNAVSILTGTLNAIFDLIVILIMSLYLLADGGRFVSWLFRLVPEAHREQASFFVGSLNRVLGGYIRGQLIVAITIGILAGVGCWVIGVPYALLLGIFAFLAESIPVLGPIIASIPACLVALFTLHFPGTFFVIAWFIVIQQIEQNIVGPRITGHAVGIHPVVAMVAVIIGLEIGGIWGAFLAVPVTGTLFVVVGEGYSYFVLRKPLPTAEVPESLELETAGSTEGGGRSAAQ